MDAYTAQGFRDRGAYLQSLAQEHSIPLDTVRKLADALGPNQDFDALVANLEAFAANIGRA